MCDPVSATVGVLVGAGQAAAQGAAQSSAAKAQNRHRANLGAAQNKAYEDTIASVRQDIGLQTDALFAQRSQQIDAQRQELQNITRDSRLASSSYRAVTAEAGITGKSVEMVHSQFEREVMEYESAAARNVTNMTLQTNREAQAIYSRGQSTINQGYPPPLPPPANVDMLGIGMQGLITGISVGTSLHGAMKNPNPNPPPGGHQRLPSSNPVAGGGAAPRASSTGLGGFKQGAAGFIRGMPQF